MKIFDDNELEIYEYEGEDYERTMNFGEWRVAFMNCSDMRFNIARYERHHFTDEVYVLLEGEATLMVGDDRKLYKMEKNKIYNIKKGIWHGSAQTRDSKLLIVENHNTTKGNTDFIYFDEPVKIY